ncbi:MAG: hypothetical protein ACOX6T_15725 [Myxococcales bacterium]|jgi:hypothetical protein
MHPAPGVEEAARVEPAGHFPPARRTLAFSAAEAALVVAGAGLVAWLGSRADVFTLDGYYYLAKAKSLIGGQGLSVPWNDGADARFFWGYSLALALPVKLFGEAGFWALSAGLYAATGFVFARILRRLPVGPEGRVAAVALAVFNPVALRWAAVPMPEPLLGLLAAAAVLFALRWRQGSGAWSLLVASLFAGLALFTRAEGLLAVAAVGAAAWSRVRAERRWALLVACAVLAVAAEGVHVGYVLADGASLASLDGVAPQVQKTSLFQAAWTHVRAPYWMIFRFDSEPWLYSRFFPPWLTAVQGFVLALYLLSMVAALVSGFYKRGFAFVCAVGALVLALIDGAWHPDLARFEYLVHLGAALVLAWGLEKAFFWARPRTRATGVLALALGCVVFAGLYGVRAVQMQAARLALEAGGRDFRAIAKVVNEHNRERRPVVTDLGPSLALYLDAHAWFDGDERGYYFDAVPSGADGRDFLSDRDVRVVAYGRRVRDVEELFALSEGEARAVKAPGATVLVFERPVVAAGVAAAE